MIGNVYVAIATSDVKRASRLGTSPDCSSGTHSSNHELTVATGSISFEKGINKLPQGTV